MLNKIKEKIQYFRQHKFVRQTATLQVGNTLGNFTQALASVFLARLLQPHLFGIYSIAIGLGSLSALFLGVGAFNAAGPLVSESYVQKDHASINEVLGFLIKMILATAVLGAIYIVLLPWIGNRFYGDSMIGWYAGLTVIALFIASTSWSFLQLCLQLVGKIKQIFINFILISL